MILKNINKELRNKLQLQQCNNTTAVINRFKKIENENKYKFMIFDIKKFYSSITKKILDDSINFARQHVQIKREDFQYYPSSQKIATLKERNSMAKEKHQPFWFFIIIIIHFTLIWLYSSSNVHKYIRLIYTK